MNEIKKQFNKANQLLSEKVGGVKGTELNEDFIATERTITAYEKMLTEVLAKSQDYIKVHRGFNLPTLPVSSSGMKSNSDSVETSGDTSKAGLEIKLAQCFQKHSSALGHDMLLGPALQSASESFSELAEEKKNMELTCKQNFIEPLQSVQSKELKQITFHLKKVESRRLDYDFKRRKGPKCPPEELREAENKFNESFQETQRAMNNFLDSDSEHLQALLSFVTSNKVYHQKASTIFEALEGRLQHQLNEPRKSVSRDSSSLSATSHSKHDNASPSSARYSSNLSGGGSATSSDPWNSAASTGAAVAKTNSSTKPAGHKEGSCRMLFDFPAENEGELDLKEGEIVKLYEQVDENWYYGEIRGVKGHFPTSYAEIIVPLQ